jgi:hypothetical protein
MARNDYEVRRVERIEPPAEMQIEAIGRGDPTGSGRTRGERVVAGGVARPSWPPKRLSDDAKLKRDNPRQRYRRNLHSRHAGTNRSAIVLLPPRRLRARP